MLIGSEQVSAAYFNAIACYKAIFRIKQRDIGTIN
jgi:hypothetical protein